MNMSLSWELCSIILLLFSGIHCAPADSLVITVMQILTYQFLLTFFPFILPLPFAWKFPYLNFTFATNTTKLSESLYIHFTQLLHSVTPSSVYYPQLCNPSDSSQSHAEFVVDQYFLKDLRCQQQTPLCSGSHRVLLILFYSINTPALKFLTHIR